MVTEKDNTALHPVGVDRTSTESKVLRTVFLPISMDQDLKDAADRQEVSKGEIVRRALQEFLHRS
jgi:hypothetical protein